MNRSVTLRTEPTLRQAAAITDEVQRRLEQRGAVVERQGNGALRFHNPAPWSGRPLGILRAITSGRVAVSAGAGEPWRVRYDISFAYLRLTTLVLTLGLVIVGFAWPRLVLVQAIAALWVIVCGVPYVIAAARFHDVVRASAHDIVERRRQPRLASPASPPAEQPVTPHGNPPSPTV